jgi:hypothetical protein
MLLSNGNLKPTGGAGEGEFVVRLDISEAAPGTLGLTLTETHGGRALVQKVAPDGIAAGSGIKPGDYIVGAGKDREWRYQVILPRVIAWASLPPHEPSSTLATKKSRKTKKAFIRSLVLTIWRPQWQPDAFLMQTVQLAQNATFEVSEGASAQRAADVLAEGGAVVGGGDGPQDWKAFMKVRQRRHTLHCLYSH